MSQAGLKLRVGSRAGLGGVNIGVELRAVRDGTLERFASSLEAVLANAWRARYPGVHSDVVAAAGGVIVAVGPFPKTHAPELLEECVNLVNEVIPLSPAREG